MPFDGSFHHPIYGEVKFRGSFGKIDLEQAVEIFDQCMAPKTPVPEKIEEIPFSIDGSCETFDQEHQLNTLIGNIFDEKEEKKDAGSSNNV